VEEVCLYSPLGPHCADSRLARRPKGSKCTNRGGYRAHYTGTVMFITRVLDPDLYFFGHLDPDP
jgi:hypothetical protein